MAEPAGAEVITFGRTGRESVEPATEVITEDSAASAFALLYGAELRFCHSQGAWFRFDGSIWRRDDTSLALDHARQLARDLSVREKGASKQKLNRRAFAAGVEAFCRADRVFARTAEHWDPDPWRLGVPDGVVDLRTGHLLPGNPRDHITRSCAVSPADTADCPLWKGFLAQSAGGDPAMVRFLRQWCGYGLTGSVEEHALVFIHGGGGNGKSVFLNTVTAIMGDYAATAAMDTFTASRSDKHPTDLAMLRGARMVTASETEEGRAWAEARIKQMTGGDRLTARFMRQDFFTYVPQFKLTIIGNHKPVLHNVDDAARRRFNIVPFIVKPSNPDRELEGKLKAEWPAILRWMIDGCLDWKSHGLIRPPSVAQATDDYFSDQDLFAQWLQEECDVEPDNNHKWELTGVLYAAWRKYAERGGEQAGSVKSFSAQMQRKGFVASKGPKGVRRFVGVQVRQVEQRD